MNSTSKLVLMALAVTAAVGSASTGWAQTERSGGGANAQLVQQYQQAQAETTRLQGENAKLKSDLDAAQKQLKTAQASLAAYKAAEGNSRAAAMAAVQNAREASAKNNEETKAKMQELIGKYRELAGTLKTVESEKGQLQQQLTAGSTRIDSCIEKNDGLYQLNKEILDTAERKGGVNRVALTEPFTKIARARMENQIDEFRERANELRLQKVKSAAGPAAPAAAHANP